MGKKIVFLVGLAMCLYPVALALALDLQPGAYQITSSTEIPGMPAMPAQQVVQCLTEQEPLEESMIGNGCTIKSRQISGNTLSWTMECSQHGRTSTGSGEMTYRGDRFSGAFSTTMDAEGENMTVTTKIDGVRIGPCP